MEHRVYLLTKFEGAHTSLECNHSIRQKTTCTRRHTHTTERRLQRN